MKIKVKQKDMENKQGGLALIQQLFLETKQQRQHGPENNYINNIKNFSIKKSKNLLTND